MEHQPTAAVEVQVLCGNSPDISILVVKGPLTINNFFEFLELSRRQGSDVLIVDLTDVPYIDSAALGALVGIHVSREKANRKYALVGANDRLRTMFDVVGLSGFLVTYSTVDEASTALLG